MDSAEPILRLKGIGKFLVKLGGLPGIPVSLQLCETERMGFNDTNTKWDKTAGTM